MEPKLTEEQIEDLVDAAEAEYLELHPDVVPSDSAQYHLDIMRFAGVLQATGEYRGSPPQPVWRILNDLDEIKATAEQNRRRN